MRKAFSKRIKKVEGFRRIKKVKVPPIFEEIFKVRNTLGFFVYLILQRFERSIKFRYIHISIILEEFLTVLAKGHLKFVKTFYSFH